MVQFLGFWVANTIVLLVFSFIFKNSVVLGNATISKPVAAIFSGLILSLLTYLVMPAVKMSGLKIKGDLNIALVFLIANFIFIWIIKRLANITGLGVANLGFVLLLAIVAYVVQWQAAKYTGAMPKKKG